jgi:hypothetical protein
MKLKPSSLNMGDFGCMVTATIFQINRHMNTSTTPGQFCEWLSTHSGFTDDNFRGGPGMMLWSKVSEYTKGRLKYVGGGSTPPTNKKFTIAQVFFGRINHWVALLPGGECMDPWSGKIMKQSQWRFTGEKRYLG